MGLIRATSSSASARARWSGSCSSTPNISFLRKRWRRTWPSGQKTSACPTRKRAHKRGRRWNWSASRRNGLPGSRRSTSPAAKSAGRRWRASSPCGPNISRWTSRWRGSIRRAAAQSSPCSSGCAPARAAPCSWCRTRWTTWPAMPTGWRCSNRAGCACWARRRKCSPARRNLRRWGLPCRRRRGCHSCCARAAWTRRRGRCTRRR